MRIGIDGRLWLQSGIGRYIRNLVGELQKLDKENEYFIFLLPEDLTKLKFSKNFQKVNADFRWYSFSEQIKFPNLLKKHNLDLIHFPHFNVPIFYSEKYVVTIHDLIHQKFAMKRATTLNPLTYKIKQLGYNKAFSTAIKKSKKIITVSNYVKDELRKYWSVKEEKIVVTKEAVDERFLDIAKRLNENAIKKTLEKFNIKPPFIFYVGNAHPHKNVEGLIMAFLELRKKYQYLQLVLSGNDHYFWERIKEEFSHKDIIYTGYVNDLELIALYKSTQAFVMPSFEEGFGIPLLEAMACNTPVVSSNAGSLKEVGEDACIYFDPKNLEDMKEKIGEVLNNQKLRGQLKGNGQKRYKEFDWKYLAENTLKIYKESIL
jgi:glycosyltransferase involved in cell wall biosynthesis